MIINSGPCYKKMLVYNDRKGPKHRYVSDRLVSFSPDWLAARKVRKTANGNSILNSTASWMWRACLKKEWSLHSCLSRCVLLPVSRFIEILFDRMLQPVLMMFCLSIRPTRV